MPAAAPLALLDLPADLAAGLAALGVGASACGAAASGANSDITSLSGLTTPLSVAQGGTGASTAAGARTNLNTPSRYSTTFVAGNSVETVTHNLGTTDIGAVFVKNLSTGKMEFGVGVEIININSLQLTWGSNTTDDHRVTLVA